MLMLLLHPTCAHERAAAIQIDVCGSRAAAAGANIIERLVNRNKVSHGSWKELSSPGLTLFQASVCLKAHRRLASSTLATVERAFGVCLAGTLQLVAVAKALEQLFCNQAVCQV